MITNRNVRLEEGEVGRSGRYWGRGNMIKKAKIVLSKMMMIQNTNGILMILGIAN